MEYTVMKLAKTAGISGRTLRYYDDIGILKPARISSSGYRIYEDKEVKLLQQIMFYRELGVKLDDIKKVLTISDFDEEKILKEHLQKVREKRAQMDILIKNIEKTIEDQKGGEKMSDKERFLGLKKEKIEKNEEEYGNEIRKKYGSDKVDEANGKMMNLSEEEYQKMNILGGEITEILENAVKNDEDYRGPIGEKAARLHKKWLSFTWPSYSKEAHKGLVNMYIDDERFTKYYDKNVQGCALFLKKAVEFHI